MEIWIPVIVAFITSATSYFLARNKSKNELKASELKTRDNIKTMQASHRQELERLEREFELKADYDERDAQTELAKDLMKSPEIQKVLMREALKQIK